MRHPFILLLLLLLWSFPLAAQSQESPPETYTDGAFTFAYPAGWDVSAVGDFITLVDTDEALQIQIRLPTNVWIFGSGDATPRAILQMSDAFDYVPDMMPAATEESTAEATVDATEAATAETVAATEPAPTNMPQIDQSEIVEFILNDKSGAYRTEIDGQTWRMLLVIDVGSNAVVTLQAISGVDADLESAEFRVFEIASTFAYNPPPTPTPTENPFATFEGETVLQTGVLTFGYPGAWQVAETDSLVLQNSALPLNRDPLESGAIQVFVADPDYNALTLVELNDILGCAFDRSAITPLSIARTLLDEYGLLSPSVTQFELEQTVVGQRNAVILRFPTEGKQHMMIAIEVEAGVIVTVSATSPAGEMSQHELDLLFIAGSMAYEPYPCPTSIETAQ
jgi:hypothetical protein